MTKLDKLSLLDILPERITDEEMEALAYAIDPEMQDITASIIESIIIPRIDEIPEELVDLLAWQFHVDFYEPLGLDIEIRRALVKNSLIWHRWKGTKFVLEDMLRMLFLDDFTVEEWFEYGGEPYFFRISTTDIIHDFGLYVDLLRAIHELKNERSWLESIVMRKSTTGTTFVGLVGKHMSKFFIDGSNPWEMCTIPSTTYFGSVGKSYRHTIIVASEEADL